MSYKLFIDDERFPVHAYDDWIIARSFKEVKALVEKIGMPSHVSFDHDLGKDQPTGFDIVKWMCEVDMDKIHVFPVDFTYYVHSQNPVGAENIRFYLENYARVRNQRT